MSSDSVWEHLLAVPYYEEVMGKKLRCIFHGRDVPGCVGVMVWNAIVNGSRSRLMLIQVYCSRFEKLETSIF